MFSVVIPAVVAIVYFPKDEDLFLWLMLDTYSVIGICAIVILISLPLDRVVSVRYRSLVPMNEKRNAA